MCETQEQRRNKQQKFAQAALPRLRALADELVALANQVFAKRITYTPDDGASVMVLSFVTKQCEHLRSVRLLLDAKQHRDTHLIARTMLEGMGRLLWAFSLQPERTERWLWFGAILDWRQTLKNEEDGIEVDPIEKAELKSYVDKYGADYYRPNVRKAIARAQSSGVDFPLPEDPWDTKWTETSVESMFQEVQGKALYDSVYRHSSEWIHWGPRSILRAMQPAEWGTAGFAAEDWQAAVAALKIACQSLLQSLEVLDMHFSLGITDRLAEQYRTMESIGTGSRAAAC